MSSKNSKFLNLSKRYPILKKFYFFYNIYIRNFKFLFNSSQFGEDKKILKIFDKNFKGVYVDVGCFHPIRSNNTYEMYKKGWYGLNIDLNPLTIELFDYARPLDINVCSAISNKRSSKKLYFLGDLDSKNTLDLKHKNWLSKHFKINNKFRTPDSTFSITPDQLFKLKKDSKAIYKSLKKKYNNSEKISIKLRRSIFAKENIEKNTILTRKNIETFRPLVGICASKYFEILGKKVNKKIEKGEPIFSKFLRKKL